MSYFYVVYMQWSNYPSLQHQVSQKCLAHPEGPGSAFTVLYPNRKEANRTSRPEPRVERDVLQSWPKRISVDCHRGLQNVGYDLDAHLQVGGCVLLSFMSFVSVVSLSFLQVTSHWHACADPAYVPAFIVGFDRSALIWSDSGCHMCCAESCFDKTSVMAWSPQDCTFSARLWDKRRSAKACMLGIQKAGWFKVFAESWCCWNF